MTYTNKLRSPEWQKKRLKILQRDNWACCKCADRTTTLNVHHLKYSGDPWETEESDLITLCEDCHMIVSEWKIDLLKDEFTSFKIPNIEGYFVCAIYENGIIIYKKDAENFKIIFKTPHKYLKNIIQHVINYWLLTGNENLLIDKSLLNGKS